jgi:hypothetical protein
MLALMGDVFKLIWWVVIGLFRSRASLDAEIVALRHQLNVLRTFDRLFFASLYRIAPRVAVLIGPILKAVACFRQNACFPALTRSSRCKGAH